MKELKRLFPYLKKYRHKLYLGFLVVTISNICSTYVPRVVGGTVDYISGGSYEMSEVMIQIGTILLLVFFSGLFMFFTRRTIIVASREIEYELRRDLLDSVQAQSMNFFHRNPTGSLMAHATNDIPATREFLGPAIMYSANTITTFIFALYFMLTLNPAIALIALVPLPLVAWATYIMGKKIHVAFKDVQGEFAKLTSQAQESISGVRIIRAYTREFFEALRFKNISKSYLMRNLRLAKIEALMMPALMVLVGLSQLAVLGYGGRQVINGTATLGDLTQFFIYLELLIWPVAAIGWVTNLIQRGAASSARLGKLMEEVPEIREDENTDNNIPDIKGDIELQNVTLQYSENSPAVLKNVNLKIKRGETLGIVGAVGSGKSSFVNLIPRLYETTEGEIFIDGRNIKEYPFSKLREAMGVVPQESFLFSDTIKNNIRFSRPGATDEEIDRAARMSSLYEEIFTFAEGYETELGERGITLSGGQKQRVAIARSLIRDPKILILDDSLSAVDANTEEKILGELKEFMKGRTTIIISHRISAVKNADNIICLDDGEIVESGTHESLLAHNGKYAEMHRLQQIEEEVAAM